MKKEEDDRNLGRVLGFLFASMAKGEIKKPVMIGKYRLHHYWAAAIPRLLNIEDPFTKGFLEGVGLDDLPDLVKDLDKFIRKLKERLGF